MRVFGKRKFELKAISKGKLTLSDLLPSFLSIHTRKVSILNFLFVCMHICRVRKRKRRSGGFLFLQESKYLLSFRKPFFVCQTLQHLSFSLLFIRSFLSVQIFTCSLACYTRVDQTDGNVTVRNKLDWDRDCWKSLTVRWANSKWPNLLPFPRRRAVSGLS